MPDHTAPQRDLQTLWAAAMFSASLLFLMLLASLTVLWIDVPRLAESTAATDTEIMALGQRPVTVSELQFEQTAFSWGTVCGVALLLLWPVFVAEQIVRLLRCRSLLTYRAAYPFGWLICFLPPLRMCERQRDRDGQLWLPWGGWQVIDRQLQRELERHFSVPMILIALLILPVLGLQFYFRERIFDYPVLRLALHIGTGVIWFAFTVEFIVMVSVADKKLRYCRQHWLDLIIILLPLVSFLRTLRIIRATRLVRVTKLQKLTRLVRVYRLRGVMMRTLRALMLLEVIHRLIPVNPAKRLARLEEEAESKELELAELREEIAQLRSQLQSHDSGHVEPSAPHVNVSPPLPATSPSEVGNQS